MTIFDDFERMKKTALPQITIIAGEQDDLVSEIRDQILDFVKFDSSNLSQSYFDLVEADDDAALEELESLPFFDDERLVIFENLWDLTTAKKSVFNEGQLARFAHYLDEPLATTRLILIFHGKLDSRLKLTKKLKKTGVLLEANPMTPQELQRYFMNKSGLKPKVLLTLAEKSNFSFSIMRQNIAILKTFAGGREITEEDIERVVPKSLQDNIFDLTTMIFKGQIQKARELVADLIIGGDDIIKILAILTNSYRLYYQVKIMQGKSWSESKMTSQLKIHPYRVKLAAQAVNKISREYLSHALSGLIDLDFAIKTGRADKELLFDVQISKLSSLELFGTI
ncbi:MAG: DNA polymerase III subunit delta [Streptococcaceae bacterium]|jgi:DNA polymerase-3 subunit delta|nr:DNA polymerase III subunit delta [Streptococcaceae bacterium]